MHLVLLYFVVLIVSTFSTAESLELNPIKHAKKLVPTKPSNNFSSTLNKLNNYIPGKGNSSQEDSLIEKIKKDIFTIYTKGAFAANEVFDTHVAPEDVKFFLFTRQQFENYTEIDPAKPDLHDQNVQYVFIIHGWLGSRENDWYEDLKTAFLNRKRESHVIQVDWSDPAFKPYTLASHNTKDVGRIVGEFVVKLHKNNSIPLENILLVGHSLGGQVSGYAGKKVKELTGTKLPRIVALDPAGPFFSTRPEEERLNKDDAEVVQVVHSNGGIFGFRSSCGTIDFYPNGGSLQPGCVTIDLLDFSTIPEPVFCHHQRSWQFFIEAVLNPAEFVGTKCKNWAAFKGRSVGLCHDEEVAMGDLESQIEGDFYLATNREKPFAKSKEGNRRFPVNAIPTN